MEAVPSSSFQFSATALKAAGVGRKALRDAGYSIHELYAAGFRLEGAKWVGYTLEDHVRAGATLRELRDAAYIVEAAALFASG